MNKEKTEYTAVKRGSKEEETEWRNVIKLGSKLGDWEDIQRRKELATIALMKNNAIWKKNWKMKVTTRIRLYETLVKSVLLYNCGTWGVSKDDQRKLNSFYRRQLRKVLGSSGHIKYPTINCIRSQKQGHYCQPSWQRKWKLLGHILRLPTNCPARKAIEVLFWKEDQ